MELPSFASKEEHLRQRAERGWFEDEDVAICIAEIDRLRLEGTYAQGSHDLAEAIKRERELVK